MELLDSWNDKVELFILNKLLNKLFLSVLVRLTLMGTLCLPLIAQAYTGITIVLSSPSKNNAMFVENFKEALLASQHHSLKVKVIDLSEVEKLIVAENSELVIALGVKALRASSKLKFTTPVLGVFTPLPIFNELLRKSGRSLGIFSAIVLDQPYQRQIALTKVVLPNLKRIGVLLGPTSAQYEGFLRAGGEKSDLIVNVEAINSDLKLIPKLKRILEENEALLAIPDPVVYNRETAQAILLTSYRHQKPVFGYSRSYVRAGALASVYSSAMHLSKQAAEIAMQTQQAPGLLPPPQVPKYFSVQVNRQVARSLNISLGSESGIYKQLLQLEAN